MPMSMLVLMAVQRVPASLLSNPPMTLAMLFSNSMVMIGKAAHWKSVKIVSPVLRDSGVVHAEALVEVVVASVADLAAVEASVVVADLASED